MTAIDKVLELFANAQIELTAEELADGIWLCAQQQMDGSEAWSAFRRGHKSNVREGDASKASPDRTTAGIERISRIDSGDLESETTTTGSSNYRSTRPLRPSAAEGVGALYAAGGPTSLSPTQARVGSTITIARASTLPSTRRLNRACGPLRRRLPSSRRLELDEDATASNSAECGLLLPVFGEASDWWLGLELVVETSAPMAAWQQEAAELSRFFGSLGVFRYVRSWRLSLRSENKPCLMPGLEGLTKPCTPETLLQPHGKVAILLMTDCVSDPWRSSQTDELLHLWGDHHSLTILQMLPGRLWDQTMLFRAEFVQVRSQGPAMPNSHLVPSVARSWWSRPAPSTVQSRAIPIIPLEPEWLSRWAGFVVGRRGASIPAVHLSRVSAVETSTAKPASQSAEIRWTAFCANASRTARRLIRLLSAAPLHLPVMRLVQRVLLPGSDSSHLAEVILGGLMYRIGGVTGAGEEQEHALKASDQLQFEFYPGLRDLLLDSASVFDSLRVQVLISDYLAQTMGSSNAFNFRAYLTSPDSALSISLDENQRPFATIGAEVLRRLGIRYRNAAAALLGRMDQGPSSEEKYRNVISLMARQALSGRIDVSSLARQALACGFIEENDFRDFIRDIIAEIDHMLSLQVNAILHHEEFTRLEGTWRGLQHLVSRCDSGESVKIKVLDIQKRELARNLEHHRGAAWDQGPLFKLLYQPFEIPGGQPFGCVLADWCFSHSAEDVRLLHALATIGSAALAPILSGAAPALFGLNEWNELQSVRDLLFAQQSPEYAAWRGLRESEDSRFICLTVPRFLARLPYGGKTVPVEPFSFEESVSSNNCFVWCNSAYAMAANMARAFSIYGWVANIRGSESGGLVEGLPVYTFPTDDGGTDMESPTEVVITDRRESELSRAGLAPLIHYKNTDFAAFLSAQSLHRPVHYENADATANAILASRLPYLMAAARFMQYLKCIVRDKIGTLMERASLEEWLNNWLIQYVTSDTSSSEVIKAKYPLGDGLVHVEEVAGDPGRYNIKLYVRPHYQLEGLSTSLRLVSQIRIGRS